MVEIPIINVEVPKPENLVWGENYNEKKDKNHIYKILAYLAVIAALIIFFRFALLAYLYIANLPKINSYDASIERIALTDDGKVAYIKLTGGNSKEIDSIKFVFRSNESEFVYETKDGIKEITYEDKRFLSYFAHPEYEGSYDYSVNAVDVGLVSFRGINEVDVVIKYKDKNTGEIKETKTIDTTKKEDIKVVRSGGYSGGGGGSGSSGSSGGGSGTSGNNPTCTPSCSGKTCGSDGCSGTCGSCNDNNECTDETCNSGSCSFVNKSDGSICSTGSCKAGRCVSCQSDSECNDNINCTTDKCTLGRCEITTNNNLCQSGNICDRFYGCVPEIHITQEWLNSKGSSPYYLDQTGATYILETDVRTNGSAFLVSKNNIKFNLNSHTITYADMNFTGVINPGFEIADFNENIPLGWDLSNAPHSRRISYLEGLFYDNNSLLLRNIAGDSFMEEYVLSSPVYLPLPGKYAVFASIVGGPYPIVWGKIRLDDSTINCTSSVISGHSNLYNGTDMSLGIICEFTISEPLTVRAKIIVGTNNLSVNTSIRIDNADIRPIGKNYGERDQGYSGIGCYGWCNIGGLEVMNGNVIEGRSESIYSPGIVTLSNSKIHDLKVITNGMNSQNINGIWVSYVDIHNNYFEANGKNPLHRHYGFGMLDFGRSTGGLKIYNNTLINGPHLGIILGDGLANFSEVYNNYISIKTIATNGFSIASGSNTLIHDNIITPIQGHGIGVTTGHNVSIYNNLIEPRSWPCSEYSRYSYANSAHGIRLKTYGGSGRITGLRIFNNTIIGRTNPQLSNCYTEISGITNYITGANNINNEIFNNLVEVYTDEPFHQMAVAYKSSTNVEVYNNTFKSNHIIFELSDTDSGYPNNAITKSNILIKADNPNSDFHTLRFAGNVPINVSLIDFSLINGANLSDLYPFGGGANMNPPVQVAIKWHLYLTIQNSNGEKISNVLISVYDINNTLVSSSTTDENGYAVLETLESINYYSNKFYREIKNPNKIVISKSGIEKTVYLSLENSIKKTFNFDSSEFI